MIQKLALLMIAVAVIACGGGKPNEFANTGLPDKLTFKTSNPKVLTAQDQELLKLQFKSQGESLLEASFSALAPVQDDLTLAQKQFIASVKSKCMISAQPSTASSSNGSLRVCVKITDEFNASASGASCPISSTYSSRSVVTVNEVTDKSRDFYKGDAEFAVKGNGTLNQVGNEKGVKSVIDFGGTGKQVVNENVRVTYITGKYSATLTAANQMPLSAVNGEIQILNKKSSSTNSQEMVFNGTIRGTSRLYQLDVSFKDGSVESVFVDGNKMDKSTYKIFGHIIGAGSLVKN